MKRTIRAVTDYVVGFALLAGGVALLSFGLVVNAAFGVVCVPAGAAMVLGLMIAWRKADA